MKILITGGAGYLGGCVVDYLVSNGLHDITVYDNLLYEDSYRKNVKNHLQKIIVRTHSKL